MEKKRNIKRWLLILIPAGIALAIFGMIIANILLYQNRPVGIRVISVSHQSEYYVGEELNTQRLTVELFSEAKSLRYLSPEEYTVTGFDSSKAGTVTLQVQYGEFKTSFTVTVKELPHEIPSYESLEIFQMPAKTVYQLGERLDVTGGVLKIRYTDGSYDLVELMPLMTSGFSSDVPGTVPVRVDYLGMTVEFPVEVVAP